MGRKFGVVGEPLPGPSAGVSLANLRHGRQLSQEAIAERLGARQPSISKLERRTDLHLSTLRAYVEALGGTLEILARFPDGDVPIGPFGESTSHQYPIANVRRQPQMLHERPAPPVARRRTQTVSAAVAGGHPSTFDQLRALRRPILEIASRHGASNLRVFGSVARGEARADSDVDLLITAGRNVGPWFPGGLAAELGELLARHVDVVTEQALAPELREKVLREAVPL